MKNSICSLEKDFHGCINDYKIIEKRSNIQFSGHMKTAIQSSSELLFNFPKQVISTTKDVISEEGPCVSEENSNKDGPEFKMRGRSNPGPNLTSLLKSTSSLVEEMLRIGKPVDKHDHGGSPSTNLTSIDHNLVGNESNSKKPESLDFVLSGTVADEDADELAFEEERALSTSCQPHESLEDFRKRIRRRTRRHLSRKMRNSSRNSYSLGSSTGCDMEDISEEEVQ